MNTKNKNRMTRRKYRVDRAPDLVQRARRHVWQFLGRMQCLGRPDGERDLDGALIFLASECSRYVTGQTLLVDGGISTGRLRAMPLAQLPLQGKPGIRTKRSAVESE